MYIVTASRYYVAVFCNMLKTNFLVKSTCQYASQKLCLELANVVDPRGSGSTQGGRGRPKGVEVDPRGRGQPKGVVNDVVPGTSRKDCSGWFETLVVGLAI